MRQFKKILSYGIGCSLCVSSVYGQAEEMEEYVGPVKEVTQYETTYNDGVAKKGNYIWKTILNEKGKVTEEYCYDQRDEFYIYKRTFHYDDNGHEIARCEYDGNGKLYYKKAYKYDKNGNQIDRFGFVFILKLITLTSKGRDMFLRR